MKVSIDSPNAQFIAVLRPFALRDSAAKALGAVCSVLQWSRSHDTSLFPSQLHGPSSVDLLLSLPDNILWGIAIPLAHHQSNHPPLIINPLFILAVTTITVERHLGT